MFNNLNRWFNLELYFNATLLGIDIYIEDTEAFNNLINKIGKAYQLSVKKAKKDYYKRIKFT